MTRDDKIQLLQDIRDGRGAAALEALRKQQEEEQLRVAIKKLNVPIIKYIALALGEPDEDLRLRIVTEFVIEVRACKTEAEVLMFVQSFEKRHGQEIADYVTVMKAS